MCMAMDLLKWSVLLEHVSGECSLSIGGVRGARRSGGSSHAGRFDVWSSPPPPDLWLGWAMGPVHCFSLDRATTCAAHRPCGPSVLFLNAHALHSFCRRRVYLW